MNIPNEIWTVGHSRHTLEEFIGLLKACRIEAVADVRRFPVSSRFPHFSQIAIFKTLSKEGIEYVPFTQLGGRRRPKLDSPNTCWHNESFRGFADFMMTPAFHRNLELLMELAAQKRTAIMCAEAIWWRCHRALIADYLKAAGVKVVHILSENKLQEHPYTSAAHLVDGKLTYAPVETLEFALS